MSYIRSQSTYAYPDGDGGLVIHTDHCIDQWAGEFGNRYKKHVKAHGNRYLIQLPAEEFRMMVRRILEECHPEWVTPKMIDDWMKLRADKDEEFKKESGG